jgi:hypothetical protein
VERQDLKAKGSFAPSGNLSPVAGWNGEEVQIFGGQEALSEPVNHLSNRWLLSQLFHKTGPAGSQRAFGM